MTSINSAMIFAAGFGKRLRPLTDNIPKPLLPIKNTCCLELAINALKKNGISKIVINIHHLKEKIEDFCKDDLSIKLIEEVEILETGGGLLNALSYLDDVFIAVNADIWIEDFSKTLSEMLSVFDNQKMDNLLLMVHKENALYYEGQGDYFLKEKKNHCFSITHKKFMNEQDAPYIFGGVQIWKKSAIQSVCILEKHFSMRKFFDYFDNNNQLYGYNCRSNWCDIGTLEVYKKINK